MIQRPRTAPGTPAPRAAADDEPTILGFPAEIDSDEDDTDGDDAVAVRLVVLRRPDRLAGAALVLAGIASAVSLALPWVRGEREAGLPLLLRGLEGLDAGWAEFLRSGLWQPVAIVLGGGVLLLLGLLLFLPAHTHRLLGVLALVAALTATAAVLSLLAGAGWRTERFDVGTWAAVAVAGLGVLGALKAMLSLPRVAASP
jgi:hypothetical protein